MKDLIIVRGGGDLATGTIYKLRKSDKRHIRVRNDKDSLSHFI